MTIYHTDKHKRYNGRQSVAKLNQNYKPDTHDIEDKYHYNPRTESLIKPMETVENRNAFLIGVVWVDMIDRIGQHYYEQDGTKVKISERGVDVPDGCMQNDPGSVYHDSHDGVSWIENIVKKEADESESIRQAKHEVEKADFVKKTLSIKEQWVKDRLQETTLDTVSKVALGKIFRKLISFVD